MILFIFIYVITLYIWGFDFIWYRWLASYFYFKITMQDFVISVFVWWFYTGDERLPKLANIWILMSYSLTSPCMGINILVRNTGSPRLVSYSFRALLDICQKIFVPSLRYIAPLDSISVTMNTLYHPNNTIDHIRTIKWIHYIHFYRCVEMHF